jgi:hypothetical protein
VGARINTQNCTSWRYLNSMEYNVAAMLKSFKKCHSPLQDYEHKISPEHTQTRLTKQYLDVSCNIVEYLDASRRIFKNLRASLIIKLHQGASDNIRVFLDASGTSGKISEH